jgi:hypothetical protein
LDGTAWVLAIYREELARVLRAREYLEAYRNFRHPFSTKGANCSGVIAVNSRRPSRFPWSENWALCRNLYSRTT